jgi:uncharacterized protein YdhG (YjbR/CyaY superfamily)
VENNLMNDDTRQYLDNGSAEQQALFARLQALVRELYPDAQETMYYGLPTWKSGTGQMSLGFWKSGVSLYTTGPQYIDPFRAAHPRIKTNKASINFKLGDDLPVEDVKGVITRAMTGR